MSSFAVVLLTAAPMGLSGESAGAFVKIDGREALLRSAELFLNRPPIAQIQLVFAADELEKSKRKYGPHLSFAGVKVIGGGSRWMEQWAAAAEKLLPQATHVILHDAARPAVAYSDIDALLESAPKHDVITLTTPSRSALIELDERHQPIAVHSPGAFVQAALPMVMTREKFLQAAQAKVEPHVSQWHLLEGSPLNTRVGHAGDAAKVKLALSQLPKPKSTAPLTPFDEAQW